MQDRKRFSKDRNPSSADEIGVLIKLVRRNPTLYNYKLQPNQRRRTDVNRGWQKVAEQMGEKYTVEECRRKWKNLRDTYHQYRLRKPKDCEGLKKWRYAKDLSFLSDVYQPKLKSERAKYVQLHSTQFEISTGTDESNIVNLTDRLNVNTEPEEDSFILHTYKTVHKSSTDGIIHDNDNNCMQIELSASEENPAANEEPDDENCLEPHPVKNEHIQSVDDDGGEIDYEEVCIYDDSTTTCGPTKEFHLIDAKGFTINEVVSQVMTDSNPSSMDHQQQHLIKPSDLIEHDDNHHHQFIQMTEERSNARDELDLFFEFLKNKMLRLTPVDITAIQVEFLNCVLRREAEIAQKQNAIT